MHYLKYTDEAVHYLKSRDKVLGEVIDRLGHIEREADDGLFPSIIHQIIAQQISNKAQAAVWSRVQSALGTITPDAVMRCGEDALRAAGLSHNKVRYVKNAAEMVLGGQCDLRGIERMTDSDAVEALTMLKGVGRWTAEMVLIFGLERPDVLSRGDAGIKRGVKLVYGREADDALFDEVQSTLSPWCSVASLYFWQV